MPVPLFIAAAAITGGAAAGTMALVDTYEENILERLEEIHGPKFYEGLQLSKQQAMEIIGKARFYIHNKIWLKNWNDLITLREIIARDMAVTDAHRKRYILALLNTLKDIKAQDGALFTYLSTSPTPEERLLEDTIKRGETIAEGAAKVVTKSTEALNKGLPWYLRPKNLAIGAAVVAGLYGLTLATPYLKALTRKRRNYKPNPNAEKIFADFMGRKSRGGYEIETDNFEELADLGSVLDIGYRSSKWKRRENYLHSFKNPPPDVSDTGRGNNHNTRERPEGAPRRYNRLNGGLHQWPKEKQKGKHPAAAIVRQHAAGAMLEIQRAAVEITR